MKCLYICSWLLMGMLVVFGGCSDENDPVAPKPAEAQVLGIMGFDVRGGIRSFPDTLELSFQVGMLTPAPALLFKIKATRDFSGSVITVDASTNPEFADAVSLLVNGVDNQIGGSKVLLPGGGGGGIQHTPESDLFNGGISGNFLPDFSGARITHLDIAIDEISFLKPGSDPNLDGLWTDYRAIGRVAVMGHLNPEVP